MKDSNVIQDNSFAFAVRIAKLYRHLRARGKEGSLIGQLLRSGTSSGANEEEAIGSQSIRDFISKLGITYEEARKSHYWLRLFREAEIQIEKEAMTPVADELHRIIGSIIKTSKGRSSMKTSATEGSSIPNY